MWRYASNYALGTDKSSHEMIPIIPEFFKDKKINDVACGGFHTIWLTNKNELYSCGLSCYEVMTNSIWTFDPKTTIIQQFFSLDSCKYKNITAKDIIASPATPDTILIYPSFVIPCTAGDLCEAKRVVVALIAQLDLMATKQQGDWKKFVIGQNEDNLIQCLVY